MNLLVWPQFYILAFSVKEEYFFVFTFTDVHMGRQKVPQSDFQSHFSTSKIIQIFISYSGDSFYATLTFSKKIQPNAIGTIPILRQHIFGLFLDPLTHPTSAQIHSTEHQQKTVTFMTQPTQPLSWRNIVDFSTSSNHLWSIFLGIFWFLLS